MKLEQWHAIQKLDVLATDIQIQHNTPTELVDGWLEKWASLNITRASWAALGGFVGLFAMSKVPGATYEYSINRNW